MSRLEWDKAGKHYYEAGVKNGVLYRKSATTTATSLGYAYTAYPWNGLVNVDESPEGADENAFYADDMKYLSLYSAEEYGFSIESYGYPKEFRACNGMEVLTYGAFGQQSRENFCFSYRTQIGNDDMAEAGFKIHVIFNCHAEPTGTDHATIDDNVDAVTASFDCSTTPITFKFNNISYTTCNMEFKVPYTAAGKMYDSPTGMPNNDGLTSYEWAALRAIIWSDGADTPNDISPEALLTAVNTASAPTSAA